MPLKRPLVAGTFLILLAAIPIFATMPRIREPFILGRGGTAGIGRTTGFSESVDLSLTSTIRSNRTVALRVQYEGAFQAAAEMRFKGATYDRYEDRSWFRLLQHGTLLNRADEDRVFELTDGPSEASAVMYLEPLGSDSLILPVETLSVKIDSLRSLGIDPGGAVLLPGLPRRDTLRYEVALARQPQIVAKLDPNPESELAALDLSGLTPRMADLAVELMGEGTAEERIDRLEQGLLTGYSYTVDFVGRDGQNPLEDFLFVYKSGHCEYFASAMVLLLRSQGIPARFVTGFLGAEYNPLEDYYIVRQQNAHAWVEAYTEGRGWQVYDPTPPDGRPAIAPPSLSLLLTQIYDFVTFRWDRYVLTYGADDQRSFFQRLRERWDQLVSRIKDLADGDEPAAEPAGESLGDPAASREIQGPTFWQPRLRDGIWFVLVLAVAAALLWHRARKPLTGEVAYRRLRRRLARAGIEIDDTLPPLELEQRAVSRYPGAGAPLRRVVALYLRESFAEQELSAAESAELREALRSIFEAIRAAQRERRASPALPAVAEAGSSRSGT